MAELILVAQSKEQIFLLPKMANRHGLIAGATGTGKTVTLQTLAENFSARGVPVLMADVKGDLAGLSQPGGNNPNVVQQAKELKIEDFKGEACPVVFWDVFGEQGHPVRATVSEMGPLRLGRLLELNDTQEGVLNMVFKIADENGLLLLDLKDLRSMLQYVADNADQFKTQYGNISAASAGAIQRSLLSLESQGADKFFGEPALNLDGSDPNAERQRRDQHPCCGQVDAKVAEGLCDIPALDALGVVRESSRNWRSGKTEARFLFRRSASAFDRHCAGRRTKD